MKNCLLSAAAQLHRPLSWLCFQMYALLLLQLMDHRKGYSPGDSFRPEHPYETHARLLLLYSVHDKFHRTLILSGFCFLKIAKISLNSSFFPKPIKR
ncbi:hypothetical protein EIC79_02200 [Salmonella enterica subsp. enterica serovar Derby]|nr:hypothetical protein EIC79_02200 [Salmonella enterica subsp. enterica serovar Derby]